MPAQFETTDSETARQALEYFIREGKQSFPLASYADLQEVITPNVVPSLLSFILNEGDRPVVPRADVESILSFSYGRNQQIRGVAMKSFLSGPPAVLLQEYQKGTIPFRKHEVSHAYITSTGSLVGGLASQGNRKYSPYETADFPTTFFQNAAGYGLADTETGVLPGILETAEATSVGSRIQLNGFLNVVMRLTSQLLEAHTATSGSPNAEAHQGQGFAIEYQMALLGFRD